MKRKREPKPLLLNDFLNEDFEVVNTREGELREFMQEVSDATHYEIVHPSSFQIYSLIETRNIKENTFRVAILDPDYADLRMVTPKNPQQCYFRKENHTMGIVSISNLKKIGMTDKQVDEIERNGFFLQYRTEKGTLTLIPSKAFLATLCRQL